MKKEDKEKSKSQLEETIPEKVKLRKQKTDDDVSPLEGDDSVVFVNISEMPPLEGDEEAEEGKGLKVLTPNKLLTILPIL